jgi:membrane-associated protease RseP (regulator of RpoE activity)
MEGSLDEVKSVEFQYGLLLLRTKRFQSVMDRLGSRRISKPIGWALLYILPVSAAIGLFIFLSQETVFFSPVRGAVASTVRGVTPLAYLGLPGINPYLPWLYGWIALVVAMVVHEGAHGVVARSLGLPVKSSGLVLLLVIPIGAFVEVDEDAMKAAKARDSGRVLAAGAGVNFVLGVVCLLLLFSVVSSMTPAANGIGVARVITPSPAATSGVKPGDFIVAVNGTNYDDGAQFRGSSWYHPGQVVNVTISRGGQLQEVRLIVGARPNTTVACAGSPSNLGPYLCTATLAPYLGDMQGENITFSSSGSGTFSSTECVIQGNSCSVSYSSSGSQGTSQTISASYAGDAQNSASSGSVQLSSLSSTTDSSDTTTLANSEGYIGTITASYSALQQGVSSYTGALFSRPILYLCIPTFPQCQSQVPFSNSNAVFYSSSYGSALVPLATLLYWLFFLNFNLAVFNALPLYPLDGGQAFRLGVQALGRGKLSERALTRISIVVALIVIAVIFSFPAAAYLGLI